MNPKDLVPVLVLALLAVTTGARASGAHTPETVTAKKRLTEIATRLRIPTDKF